MFSAVCRPAITYFTGHRAFLTAEALISISETVTKTQAESEKGEACPNALFILSLPALRAFSNNPEDLSGHIITIVSVNYQIEDINEEIVTLVALSIMTGV